MADLYFTWCDTCNQGPTDCLVFEDGHKCLECFDEPPPIPACSGPNNPAYHAQPTSLDYQEE